MTPPPPPPLAAQPLLAYRTPVPPRRPTSVTVLAIIGIVFASLALLSFVAFIALVILFRKAQVAAMGLVGSQYLQYALSLVFNATLLWLCVAALKLLPRTDLRLARWAWAYLAWVVFDYVVALVMILIPAKDEEGVEAMWIAIGGYAIISVLSCVYPAFWLFYLRKPHVRAAFEPVPPEVPLPGFPVANFAERQAP